MKTILFLLVACLVMACSQPPMHDNGTQRNKERMKQFYEQLVNAHNAVMVDSFFDANVIDHSGADTTMGSSTVKKGFELFFAAFPDAHLEQHAFIGSGDTVAVMLTMTGTNTGPMRGGPPTNKSINITGMAVFAWKDGKIVERWRYFDDVLMMQQLGMTNE